MIRFRMALLPAMAFTTIMFASQVTRAQVVALGSANSRDEAEVTDPLPYGVWTSVDSDDRKKRKDVMRLKVYPQAAPVPALSYRLVPDPADRTSGNSAPLYMKAMGFMEQTNARLALVEMQRKWREAAADDEQSGADYPPDTWRETPPEDLPLDEVKKYLNLLSFQEAFLFDAARRKNYSQERAMELEDNPIGYLLPEVQQMRELARQQSVRLRFAIAENRIDDAVEIVGQVLAMANHISQDDFMVSGLVGVAIEGIATSQGLALSQHPDTPNLYWAIAACPKPMIDLSAAIEFERKLLTRQFPSLLEVDETVKSKEYWADFTASLVPKWKEFAKTMNQWNQRSPLPDNLDQFQMAMKIASQYDSARRFLTEVAGMESDQLDKYPSAQIVFLALKKYHAIATDEETLRFHIPFSSQSKFKQPSIRKQWRDELGWIAEVSESLLFAGEQIHAAATREKQRLALWQTVEAIRMTAAANEGRAPASLTDLVVPAPLDPVTDEPFEYSANDQTITVTGARVGGQHFRLIVELANIEKEQN
jgi:hypothetical protein